MPQVSRLFNSDFHASLSLSISAPPCAARYGNPSAASGRNGRPPENGHLI